ncbi:MAG: prepilin-type N-terminal cleavage/methylation domain-containing protein [Planctomycetaceae bacterium]
MTSTATQADAFRAARRGFSLFELMLVLALAGGLAGMAMPAVMKWQQRLQLDQAIHCVRMFCAESRLKAIQTGHAVCVQVVREGRAMHSNAWKNEARGAGLPAGYTVQQTSAERTASRHSKHLECVFFPDGTANPTSFLLFDARQQPCAELRIDPLTGSVSLR